MIVFQSVILQRAQGVHNAKHICVHILFGIMNTVGALQDKRLKNYHPLRVLLPRYYTFEIHRKGSDKYSPNFSRLCVVPLGWHTCNFFHLACHLPFSVIPPSRSFPGFLCTQSWYTQKRMSSAPRRHTFRSSLTRSRTVASPASTRGCGR